jgi:glycosyltransferase involved in cell wall biosynthesis
MTTNPIRVAIVHYRDDATVGGSLRVGETIANHVDPKKVEAHLVFAYGEEGTVAKRARVPCHFIKAKGPKDFLAWLRARALFKELAPDVIHYQDAVIWLRTALLGTGYKTLLHVHGRYLPRYMNWKSKLLTHAFISKTDAQVCITSGARDALLSLGCTRPEKVAVVYNSVDVNRFSSIKKREEARAHLGIPEDILLLGMVARLVRHRGCSEAVAILSRLDRRWHLAFCGTGPARQELEDLANKEGVYDRIHFIEVQDDVRPVYAAMNAFLFLARYDSFGLATCEAMAAGVPVFGLAGEGEYQETQYPLITTDNSVFVPRNNPGDYESTEPTSVLDDLACRIQHFGNHPHQYSEMKVRAFSWIRERFDAPIQANAMINIYEQLSGHNRKMIASPSSSAKLNEQYNLKNI